MASQIFDESPKELQLITSDDESHNHKDINKTNGIEKVQMKKQLGLLEGVAIILGIICGSGINNSIRFFYIPMHSPFSNKEKRYICYLLYGQVEYSYYFQVFSFHLRV